MSITVTATGGGAASPGIQLAVMVLGNATVGSPNINSQSGTGAHDVSVTPVSTGGLVFAATFNEAAAVTPAAGQTTINSLADTFNTLGYGAFQSGSTTANTPVTVGVTDTAAGGVAALEVQPSGGGLFIDGSSPRPITSYTATTASTASFVPPAGDVLVAIVSCGGTGTQQPVSMTLSDSFGLTWTCAAEAATEGNGYAGIWYAVAQPVVAISTTALADGTVGYAYSHQLVVSGGWGPPYSWFISSGSLPAGLSLSGSGLISGVPTVAGSSSFTVTVGDGIWSNANQSLSITIDAVPTTAPGVTGAWHGSPSNPYFYGTLTVPIANTDHDWLFVSASWAENPETQSSRGQTIAFLSDDAHNVYQEVTYNQGGVHTQIWVVPNAAAVSKVFVSTSGFVNSLQVCVVNVHGLGAGYVIDASRQTTGGPSPTFTMTNGVTGADFVFAAGAYTGGSFSITQSGTGATWNSIYAGSNNSISQAASWCVTSAAGTVSMTYGDGGHGNGFFSGGLVAVKQAQPAPVNSNPAFPVIQVQAAFGFNQQTNPITHNWTDITSRFQGIEGTRGRSFELDELSAADITITLDNFDSALSPGNASSPYWPNVTLITPIRMLAIWQGRYHCVFSGILLAIPQSYDFQRGIVKVAMSDDYAKLPQTLLGSCMVEELLYDGPLDLWPLNEQQGAQMASNWSGRSTAILVPTGGKTGGGLATVPSTGTTGINGFPYPGSTGFGQTNGNGKLSYPVWPSGLQGTTDSVWGNIGGTPGGRYYAGTVLVNRNDTALPWTKTGATYEVWACIANVAATRASGAVIMMLSDNAGGNGGGIHFRLRYVNPGGKAPGIQVEQLSLSGSTFHTVRTPNLIDSKWHHYAVTIGTNNTITVYVDGVNVGSFTGYSLRSRATMLQFGGDATVNPRVGANFSPGFFTGFMAYGAVFDKVIDPQRINAHFLSGRTGFDRELTGARIQRVLTYAKWFAPQAIESGVARMQQFNYLNSGGYGSSGLSGSIGQFQAGGGAALDSGSQADMTISDIALSENGFLFVAADGTLTFRSRTTQYSLPVKWTLGDMDYALNPTFEFNSGSLGEWTGATGCTVSFSTGWSYDGGGSALMTVTGSPTQAFLRGQLLPVNPAQGCTMVVMSPQGAYVQPAIDWFGSSGYITTTSGTLTWCPPMTPVRINLAATAPVGGATTFHFGPTVLGSSTGGAPANGTQLYLDRPRVSSSGYAIPYENDLQITEDVQYLYNDIVITRNLDQATYRFFSSSSRQAYFPRVYTRVIYTSPADSQAVADSAGWLLQDYSQPRERVEQISIIPTNNPEAWDFCLSADTGDQIAFIRTPAGGFVPEGVFMILSVEVDWAPDSVKFTYILAPNPFSPLVLDDPIKGVLNASTPNSLGW